MRSFILGMLLGALVMGVGVEAGSLYKKDGSLNAPSGSQQQYDYFRQRQQYLDIQSMRKQAEQDRSRHNPC